MSDWTHVLGVLRIEDYTPYNESMGEVLGDLFHTFKWGDSAEKRKACNVPAGSEESLQVKVWMNHDKNDTRRYTITFSGDLRDFSDEQGIVDWVNGLIKKYEWCVRDGVMGINGNLYAVETTYTDVLDDGGTQSAFVLCRQTKG